jgi:hypothetical protein
VRSADRALHLDSRCGRRGAAGGAGCVNAPQLNQPPVAWPKKKGRTSLLQLSRRRYMTLLYTGSLRSASALSTKRFGCSSPMGAGRMHSIAFIIIVSTTSVTCACGCVRVTLCPGFPLAGVGWGEHWGSRKMQNDGSIWLVGPRLQLGSSRPGTPEPATDPTESRGTSHRRMEGWAGPLASFHTPGS